MWHNYLLQHLAKKICKSDKDTAALFINHLLNLFEVYLVKDCDFEVPMILGFIKDLYLFSLQQFDRDVPVFEFARQSLGLFILHIKSSDDLKIYISDFVPIIKDEIIFKVLMIEEELIQFNSLNCRGVKSKNSNNSLFSKEYEELCAATPDSIFIKMLTKIETDVFASIDYHVSANPIQITPVLTELLNEAAHQFEIASNLLDYLLPIRKGNAEFNSMVLEIKKIANKFSRSILNDICTPLDDYVARAKSYFYMFFFSNSTCLHSKEVAMVLKEIRQNKFTDVDTILERLHRIKITNPKDDLVGIIASMEEQYKYVAGAFNYN